MYNNGVKDKIDYSRATVLLNSARSQKISVTNSISEKLTFLKQLMGYPENQVLKLKKSFNEMKDNFIIDTLETIPFKNRIEYQLLETNIRLRRSLIGYNRTGSTRIMNIVRRSRSWSRISRATISFTVDHFMRRSRVRSCRVGRARVHRRAPGRLRAPSP